jgi:hypothetical protein
MSTAAVSSHKRGRQTGWMGLEPHAVVARVGGALVVTLVCYALLGVVTSIALGSLPNTPPDDGCSMYNCFSDQAAGVFLLMTYGPPVLLAGMLVSLLLLRVMTASSRWPVLNGAVAGLPAIALALVVAAAAMAWRAQPSEPEEPAPRVTHCIPISGGRGCPGG